MFNLPYKPQMLAIPFKIAFQKIKDTPYLEYLGQVIPPVKK